MTIYFLSGLGADERIFQYLDLGQFEKKYIKWITPEANESLSHYARRLTKQIEPSGKFILVGLSFGGIVAIEICRIIRPEKVILISSIKSYNELPYHTKLAGKLKLYKIYPFWITKYLNYLVIWFFSAKSWQQKALLRDFIRRSDTRFLRWAIIQVLNWKSEPPDLPIISIHGSSDHIFPVRDLEVDHVLPGGHLVVMEEPGEISKIIKDQLRDR